MLHIINPLYTDICKTRIPIADDEKCCLTVPSHLVSPEVFSVKIITQRVLGRREPKSKKLWNKSCQKSC